MTIKQDIQKLDAGTLVELFEINATALGGGIDYFHAGTNASRAPIVWQTKTYNAWPVAASGFEFSGRGQLPTPRMLVANIGGAITLLNLTYDDLVGAKVTRRRTFARYLDGQPGADPAAGFPDDVYFIERKVGENRVQVEYELSSAMDVEGVQLPGRQMIANLCVWGYRSAECGYAGGAVATILDVPTAVIGEDACSRRLTGCKYRFGANGPLPYGGFPSMGRY